MDRLAILGELFERHFRLIHGHSLRQVASELSGDVPLLLNVVAIGLRVLLFLCNGKTIRDMRSALVSASAPHIVEDSA